MLFSAFFGIVVGLAMIFQWSSSYLNGQIPELEDEPIRLGFHLIAEMVTAVGLVISSIGLISQADWATPIYLMAIGMLFYTVIASPGYFAQKGQWQWVGIFAVIITAGIASLIQII